MQNRRDQVPITSVIARTLSEVEGAVAISWYKLGKLDAPKEKYEPKWHHRHPVVLFVTSYREIATALKGLAMTR